MKRQPKKIAQSLISPYKVTVKSVLDFCHTAERLMITVHTSSTYVDRNESLDNEMQLLLKI